MTSRASRDPASRRTHAERRASADGYFAPESVIRRVGSSPLVPLLGGGPAVLLQVAHPLVAAGVADHSAYARELWRRLLRTLRALYLVTFGTKAEAERAAAGVRAAHARVRGVTREPLGPFPAGTPYAADDPELQLWVHATLVAMSLAVTCRFVEPLTAEEQERYYREMAVVGRLFGLPRSTIPRTLTDFRRYLDEELASGRISVTEPARRIARVILDPPLPLPMRMLVPAHRLATAGLLPPQVR
ncbi:MAG: oxygenase MpaB family protein, partial [Thermoleophilia bacterium]|nr:DUF2236 domain-containing protein [Gaiellaceae bacterium]MDW8339431.1 oxygenase MpaB family protein [Thermoleophilia bacterium]